MEAKLVIVGGKANKKEVVLRLPTIVGRSREAGLTIAHPMVSRQHCELYEESGLLMARDLGSLNGTYINKQRIGEPTPVYPKQILTVGPLSFRAEYEYAGQIATAPEAPAAQPDAPAVAATAGLAAAAGQFDLPDFSAWAEEPAAQAEEPAAPADEPAAQADAAPPPGLDWPAPQDAPANQGPEAAQSDGWTEPAAQTEPPAEVEPPAEAQPAAEAEPEADFDMGPIADEGPSESPTPAEPQAEFAQDGDFELSDEVPASAPNGKPADSDEDLDDFFKGLL